MAKIERIIDDSYKSGVAKTGKAWTKAKIETDDGVTATGFVPDWGIKVGDEVRVEDAGQWGMQFQVVSKPKQAATVTDDVSKVLNDIYKLAAENNSLLKQIAGTIEEAEPDLGDL